MKIGVLFILPVFITLCATDESRLWGDSSSGLHPVILVPGDGGSQLDAKLDKPAVVHYLCTKKTEEYFNIWLNLELLVPLVIDCWIDNVRLVYNLTTRTTENSPGVQIRVPGFGNTSTVEFLDPSRASPGLYFKFIVEQSLIPLGYVRGNDIRGAPYDFRKAPNEMGGWMKDFQALIEDSYFKGGNKSVILISHSVGGPIALYLLHQMKQSWKDKHIRALITLAAPWGGSVKAWKVFAAGDDLGVYVLPGHVMRGMQRTSPSTAFLLPSTKFWSEDEIIVSAAGLGNYTVKDYERFFRDMNYDVGYEMRKDTQDLMGNMEAPGVELHCLHGHEVKTVEHMDFKETKDFPDNPSLNMGDGDGTVNIRSLKGCLRWSSTNFKSKSLVLHKRGLVNLTWSSRFLRTRPHINVVGTKSQRVFHKEFSGVDHMEILRHDGVIDYVAEAVKRINS